LEGFLLNDDEDLRLIEEIDKISESEIDLMEGTPLESDERDYIDEEALESITTLLENLKKTLIFTDDQWIDLAFSLLIGKLINDYKYILYVKNNKPLTGRQDLILNYEIGTLINDFVRKREKDARKPEFQGRKRKIEIKTGKIINYLTKIIDYSSKNRKERYRHTTLRNFASIARDFNKEELDNEIPFYIYKEVVERIPQRLFTNARKRKQFQMKVLKLRKEMVFSDRPFRTAMKIIAEDPNIYANKPFLKTLLLEIQNQPKGLSQTAAIENIKNKLNL
jgi:hypothetical protein